MKGCQKRVIYLKNTGSELFEEAYFVVSRVGEESKLDEKNMISEANRIISDSIVWERKDRILKIVRRVSAVLLPFIFGVLITALVFAVL